MSIGPLSHVGVAAGTPLAQSKGSEVQRAGHDVAHQERQVDMVRKAENAAGVGATEGEETETSDRDADGRRLWQAPRGDGQRLADDASTSEEHRVMDPSGRSGTQLDLAG